MAPSSPETAGRVTRHFVRLEEGARPKAKAAGGVPAVAGVHLAPADNRVLIGLGVLAGVGLAFGGLGAWYFWSKRAKRGR